MTSTTIALLGQFEQEYSVNTAEITAKIGQLVSVPKSDRPAAIKEIRNLLNDVGSLLEQMDLSVRDLEDQSPQRLKYENRVASYKTDKKLLDNELERAVNRLRKSEDRTELFDTDESDLMNQTLISNTETLDRTSRKVRDAYQTIVETEHIGAEVLEDLGRQRETITRARDRLRDGNIDLTRSNQIASTMLHRIIQSRLILLILFFVLMLLLMIFIYYAI
ncbi:hypothetical protein FO519_000689 [Halicephalobus sp. NKZ332]|nr:hypothetical protein FO519_000689 [Halicephalobus sp. NKZ332]